MVYMALQGIFYTPLCDDMIHPPGPSGASVAFLEATIPFIHS
jgi:hypothetical protein